MINRTERIDEFLKQIAKYSENSDIKVNKDFIYSELVRYGVDESHRNVKLDVLFDFWIEKYKNTPNLEVANKSNNPYFCEFKNIDESVKTSQGALKMYVPLKSENIEMCTGLIFDYLISEDIKHLSTIASDIRIDDLTIIVFSKEDAQKIQHFIDNTYYIKNSLMEANPFLPSEENITYALDGRPAFNSEIASYIDLYIKSKQNSDILSEVSYDDFKLFVKKATKYFFDKELGFSDYQELNSNSLFEDEEIRAYEVSKLINMSLDGADVKDAIQFFDYLNDENYIAQDKVHLDSIRGDSFVKQVRVPLANKKADSNKIQLDDINQEYEMTKKIVDEVVQKNYKKYGFDQVSAALYQYFFNNLLDGITRDDNCREKYATLSKEIVAKIIEESIRRVPQDLDDFKLFVNNINDLSKDNNKIDYKNYILQSACLSTYDKYGFNQTLAAITQAIKYNDFNKFTKDNYARSSVKQNFTYEDITRCVCKYLGEDDLNEINKEISTDSEKIDRYCASYLSKLCVEKGKNGESSNKEESHITY